MSAYVLDVEAAVAQFRLRQQLRDAGLPLLVDAGSDFARVAQATAAQSAFLTELAALKTRNLARRAS